MVERISSKDASSYCANMTLCRRQCLKPDFMVGVPRVISPDLADKLPALVGEFHFDPKDTNESMSEGASHSHRTKPGYEKPAKESSSSLPPSLIHLISGGIAGCVAKSSIAPFDRVKILFQINHPKYAYTGVFSTLSNIAKTEGFSQLWRGNTATVARVFPYAAIQFMSYEKYKKWLLPEKQTVHPIIHLCCGSLAGATATTFTYPLDLVRARLASEVQTRTYRHIFHGLAEIYRKEGAKAWFRGMKPTLEGIIPYAGVNFGTYETLKYYAPKNEEGHVPTVTRLLCGGLSGAIGQTVSYPWDVVRRRMQIHGFAPGTKSLDYNGSLNTMRTIVRNESWRALYRGITINYFKVTPTVAISFTVYELSKNWIAGHTQRT